MNNQRLQYDIPAYVPSGFDVVGIVRMKNGCCSDRPVLITANPTRRGTINYSCQCACDGWKTNGHATASEALQEYEKMSGVKPDTSGRIISVSEIRRPKNWYEEDD